jgi:D-3-phosphoglycerate dehydrogenase / 2-oxoglutarate reductase
VLVTDYTWESTEREAAVLAEVDAELVLAERGDEQELLGLVTDADAILTCFARVSPAVVRAGTKLKVIGRYGIGVDNIAVEEATRLGIPVTNVPAYCVDEVAEHVMGLIFCLARGICRYDAAVHRGDWSPADGGNVRRIAGSTLGIIGYGKIGQAVAQRARGLGMRVVVYAGPSVRSQASNDEVEHVSLSELAGSADFVTLHVPATDQTEGLVNAEFLAQMRPSAYLINTARGAVVDQDALVDALTRGQIAGAGLDVFVPERLAPDHPLLALQNVIPTPHVAFYSEQSVADLATLAARNVAEILAGRRVASTVNPEVYETRGST